MNLRCLCCYYVIITFAYAFRFADASSNNATTKTIEVTIGQGKLSGGQFVSRNGNSYYGFLSIPYAKPPVGELRFQAPEEPEPWPGVRDAQQEPPVCVQQRWNRTGFNGQEDCLYLNVFTRQLNGSSAPVLVFIHGGGFTMGSSVEHSPYFLMDKCCFVYVSINYRLGMFGFLSSGDEVLPGNNGMKDQAAALKWIRNNIGSFGGDPYNVLIFGQSAGAGSVHLHMFSTLSKGLFHKAITFSGSALSFWAVSLPRIAREHFRMISLVTGCVWIDTNEIIRCLKQITVEDLMRIVNNLYIWNSNFVLEFGPTIELETVSGAFLTKKPEPGEELDGGRIPWITGITSAEGIYTVEGLMVDGGEPLKRLNENAEKLLPLIAAYATSIDHYSSSLNFTEHLKKIYFPNEDISLQTIGQLVNLTSDTYFALGMVNAASKYKGRRYMYLNSYKSYSIVKPPYDERLNKLGVCHGEDMAHYFEVYAKEFGYGNVTDPKDVDMSETLIEILVKFAFTGDPNINFTTPLKWDPIDDKLSPYLHISREGFRMEYQLFREKYEIWKNVSPYLQTAK